LFAALYLISVGTGGVKSALLPLGADQYDDSDVEQSKQKQAFFSWFFMAINIGVFFSGTVVVWVQQNVAWSLGFAISSVCLIVATVAFFVGTPIYRVHLPTGSPLKSLVAVFVASFKKRKVEVPADTTILFEGDDANLTNAGQNKLAHTDGFRYVYHILMEANAASIAAKVCFGLFVEQKEVTLCVLEFPTSCK
jgi:peptide/histidine transporter 3/4